MSEILVIEDESVLGRNLARALESEGHSVRVFGSGEEGIAGARAALPDLVLLDLRLPDGSGLDFMEKILAVGDQISVIMMTAYGSVADAVDAMRRGAVDYLQKPLDIDELRLLVGRVLVQKRRDRELDFLRSRDRVTPGGMVGKDPKLLSILEQIGRLRDANIAPGRRPTVLLTGESGTGKGVIAREIHELLGGGSFIDVNCTAMPASLVEAELFGHERGTFTDAKTARSGLFEAAEGGTLFLDEIGHLETGIQAKFLKAIEEKRIRRLGTTRDREIDAHIIAATNRNLDEAVSRGEFREDLLYRLRVLSFEIPPLRERPADIGLLVDHFCKEFSSLYGGERQLKPESVQELAAYSWPGNVRELRNVMERSILLSPKGVVDPEIIAQMLQQSPGTTNDVRLGTAPAGQISLPREGIRLEEVERDLLNQALELAEGNRTKAAKLLGLSRDTFRYRLEKFGIGKD